MIWCHETHFQQWYEWALENLLWNLLRVVAKHINFYITLCAPRRSITWEKKLRNKWQEFLSPDRNGRFLTQLGKKMLSYDIGYLETNFGLPLIVQQIAMKRPYIWILTSLNSVLLILLLLVTNIKIIVHYYVIYVNNVINNNSINLQILYEVHALAHISQIQKLRFREVITLAQIINR